MNFSQAIVNKDLFGSSKDILQRLLDHMDTFDLNALPVVENEVYSGLMTSEQLLELDDLTIPLRDAKLPLIPAYLFGEQHIFDGLSYFKSFQVNVIPVVGSKMRYLGFVDLQGFVTAMDDVIDSQQPGGVLVIETDLRSNSLAQITHILESNNIQVLSAFSKYKPEANQVDLTLKLNTTDFSKVTHLLSRYNFVVKQVYNYDDSREQDDITARYEHLMNYLNM